MELALHLKHIEKITITDNHVRQFAVLTGDHNPVHMKDEEAQKLGFKSRIAHGMLSASFFSAILANKFPGPGAIYLGQNIKFHAPVYLNEELTYELEVIAQKEGKPIFTISTIIRNNQNEILVSGEAIIRAPRA